MRRNPRLRKLLTVGLPVLALLAVAGLAGAASGSRLAAPSVTAAPAAVDPGFKVFSTAGCSSCHTLAAAGSKGTVGPNLDKAKPSYALVVMRVTKGKGVMPSFKSRLSAAQIKAVAKYVSSKAGKKVTSPPPKAPPATTPAPPVPPSTTPETLQGDPVAGASVFAANGCASCHTLAAAGATGTAAPNLDLAKPSQGVVRSYVTSGATAGGVTMPAFNLSTTDLNNIAAYVYASTHH